MRFQHSLRHKFESRMAGVEAAPMKHRGDADGFKVRDVGADENQFLNDFVYKYIINRLISEL